MNCQKVEITDGNCFVCTKVMTADDGYGMMHGNDPLHLHPVHRKCFARWEEITSTSPCCTRNIRPLQKSTSTIRYFYITITDGECSICFEKLKGKVFCFAHGNDPYHLNVHPLHAKCSDFFVKAMTSNRTNDCFDCLFCPKEQKLESTSAIKINNKRAFPKIKEILNSNDQKIAKTNSSTSLEIKINVFDKEVLEAVHLNQEDVLKELLERGVITNKTCGEACVLAAKDNHPLIIKILIECRHNEWEHIPKNSLNVAVEIAREKNFQEIYDLLQPIQQENALSGIFDY